MMTDAEPDAPQTADRFPVDSDPAPTAPGADVRAAAAERARLFPRVTSFRSRRGTLSPAQQRDWDELWPVYGRNVAPGPDGVTAAVPPLDVPAQFGRTAPLVLEIGCGTGVSTAAMAAVEPAVDVLAVEVYQPGIAQLLGAIRERGLTNVRVIRGDGVVVMRDMLRPGSLTGLRLFFPDPWPKARHHKRRIVSTGTLARMRDLLADDGVLHIATDHAGYAEWITEHLAAEPGLVPLTGRPSPISLERPTTKFEGRAHREGRPVTEFVLERAHKRAADRRIAE